MSTTNTVSVSIGSFGSIKGDLRTFSTGSKGWYVNGKCHIEVGAEMEPITLTIEGQTLTANPKAKPSESGNFGWYANGKITIDGQRCQVGINITACKCEGVRPTNTIVNAQCGGNLIIVGSKPTSEKPAKKVAAAPVAAKAVHTPTVIAMPLANLIAPVQVQAPETADERIARLVMEMLSGKR